MIDTLGMPENTYQEFMDYKEMKDKYVRIKKAMQYQITTDIHYTVYIVYKKCPSFGARRQYKCVNKTKQLQSLCVESLTHFQTG